MNIYGRVGWRTAAVAPSSGIDTDAQAFITAASITDSTQQSAINTLVTQLKTYGIWTKLKAVYPFVGGSASSHKFNLKDPRDLDAAFRLVFNGGWTHNSNGAKPNGTTGYADTKFVPATNQSANSNGLGVYLGTTNTALGADATFIGVYNSGTLASSFGPYSGGLAGRLNGNGVFSSAITANGFLSFQKTSSTLSTFYKNSTDVGSGNSGGNPPILTLSIGGLRVGDNTIYPSSYVNNEYRLTYMSDGLNSTEISNFYTAVQTFQTTLGRQVGVPIVADADAQAFLNAAVITDQTQANAVTTLVTDLKSANIWSKMKAIYPFVGGTATTHKFNLKDPRDLDAAFRLQFNGGWTHSSTGAQPNGSTGYADTKLNDTTLTTNNVHISYYSNTNTDYNGFEMGTYNSTNYGLHLGIKYSGQNYMRLYDQDTGLVYSNNNGLFVITRTSNTSSKGYRNNSVYKSTTTSVNNTNIPNKNIYLGALNDGVINNANFFSNKISSFASIGDGLTDAEAAAFYTAVQKYQTSLSRNV